MIRLCSMLRITATLGTTGAQAADRQKAEPQPKTIVDVVGDILMAPVKLVENLTKPTPAKPAKK